MLYCHDKTTFLTLSYTLLLTPPPPHLSLMQIGYDPSSRNPTTGRTLLHVAACGDKFACSAARKLLRKLATHEALSAKDKKGDTALLVAVKHGRVVMAHALRNIGASVEVADKAGMTPLLIAAGSAAFNAKKGHEAFMALATQMQLEKCRPSDGYTALHIAIAEDNHNLARLLTLPQQEGRYIALASLSPIWFASHYERLSVIL